MSIGFNAIIPLNIKYDAIRLAKNKVPVAKKYGAKVLISNIYGKKMERSKPNVSNRNLAKSLIE